MRFYKLVWFTTSFEAFHYWENAPEDCAFLRNPHRHIFHVKGFAPVNRSDREIEFIALKRKVTDYIRSNWEGFETGKSCEMMCEELLENFKELCRVEISEDGENGADVLVIRNYTLQG